MAKIKLKGADSGSAVYTLTTGTGSTDRTINLPDATATIATTTDVAARLPSITDGGNATAITIDSSEQVGIGQAPTDYQLVVREPNGDLKVLELSTGDSTCRLAFSRAGDPAAYIDMKEDGATGTGGLHFGVGTSNTPATTLKLTSDGRGVSQFTAKAWVNFNGSGTLAIRDSHNISSVADNGTGDYSILFDVDMANANFAGAGLAADDGKFVSYRNNQSWNAAGYARVAQKDYDNNFVDGSNITFIFFGD